MLVLVMRCGKSHFCIPEAPLFSTSKGAFHFTPFYICNIRSQLQWQKMATRRKLMGRYSTIESALLSAEYVFLFFFFYCRRKVLGADLCIWCVVSRLEQQPLQYTDKTYFGLVLRLPPRINMPKMTITSIFNELLLQKDPTTNTRICIHIRTRHCRECVNIWLPFERCVAR